jgi:hypothetical protein
MLSWVIADLDKIYAVGKLLYALYMKGWIIYPMVMK